MYPDYCMSECQKNMSEDNMAKEKENQKQDIEEKGDCTDCTEDTKVETKSEDTKEETKTENTKSEDKTEDKPKAEEKSTDTETKGVVEILSDMDRKISELTDVIATLLADKPEEETEDEEDDEEEMSKKKSEDEKEPEGETKEEKSEDTPKETKEEDKSNDINPYEDLKKSVDIILEKLGELAKNEEFKTELKARDDQINALAKKLDTIVTKSTEEKEPEKKEVKKESQPNPKTVQDQDEMKLEKDTGFIIKKGEFYHR
jgi:hypothetical protein